MSQVKLSRWLKLTIIAMGLCGILICFYLVPIWGSEIALNNSRLQNYYWHWMIFIWITSIPCYMVLFCGYKIAKEIGFNNSFSLKNAQLLKNVARLAAGDSVFCFLVNVIFMLLKMSRPNVVLIAFFISFAGGVIAVVAAVLSHLVYKSAQIYEENKLTI